MGTYRSAPLTCSMLEQLLDQSGKQLNILFTLI